MKFYANALQCTLPDPSNLKRWGLSQSDNCALCQKGPSSALHVLTGCPVSLKEGRYTWRHDLVLGIVKEAISLSIARAKRNALSKPAGIIFVREGESVKHQQISTKNPSIFQKSNDWVVLMDVGNRHYEFPPELAVTSLCSDITVTSRALKCVILV